MNSFNRARIPLIVLAAILLGVPAFSQTDFSGEWVDRITEDSYERSGGPPLGDYQGIQLNDAGRMKADSHDDSEWSLPEFQCRPHPGPYRWRALGGVEAAFRTPAVPLTRRPPSNAGMRRRDTPARSTRGRDHRRH